MRVAFIHLDLGIGGSETLLIDMVKALQKNNHEVSVFTPHHDPDHCFPETLNGTFPVKVVGDIWPRVIFNRFLALCSSIRMILAALYIIFFDKQYDLVCVDQVPACIPILRLFGYKVIFYCHFPDKLCCNNRTGIHRKIYRFFWDLIDEFSLACANMIMCNSGFTQNAFNGCYKYLKKKGVEAHVLYPPIDVAKIEKLTPKISSLDYPLRKQIDFPYFVSLNRIDPMKNIGLAVEAFAKYKEKHGTVKEKLIIAGGYEDRIMENRLYLPELKKLADDLGVLDQTMFLLNVTNDDRAWLLRNAIAVLYTPQNEHFGIVPIEAMANGSPVIACTSGGPLESVADGKSGFLLPQDAEKWGDVLDKFARNPELADKMGQQAIEYVTNKFGLEVFGEKYIKLIEQVVGTGKTKTD